MNKMLFSTITIMTLIMLFSPLQGENLFLKNGDHISGTVNFSRDMIKIKPDYCDQILISKKEAKKIIYNVETRAKTIEEIKDDDIKDIIKRAPDAKSYPDAGAIFLLDQTDINVKKDDTFVETQHTIVKILKERSKSLANYSTSYYRDLESVEVELARVIKKDGRIFYVKPDSIKITAANSKYPLYDKKDIIQFTIPEVKEGDIIETIIDRTIQKIDMLHFPDISLFFRGSEPTLSYSGTFTYSIESEAMKKFPFKYKLFNFTQGDTPEIRITKQGKNYLFNVEYGKSEGMEYEANRPPFKDLVPRLSGAATMDYNKIAKETYFRLTNCDISTPKLEKLSNDFRNKYKNKRELAKKLYEYVAFNIKRVSVSTYITDLYPTSPEKILNLKYGGKIDRLSLLYSLYKKTGLSPEYLFVRRINSGRMDREIPSIYDFSSLLLRIKINNKYIYIVNPSEYRKMGILPESYQNGIGLVISSTGGNFITLPEEPIEKDLDKTESKMVLDKSGNLHLDQKEIYYGNNEISVRSTFKSMKPLERKRSIKYSLESALKNVKLEKIEFSDLNDLSKNVTINFSCLSDNYGELAGNGKYMIFKIPFNSLASGYVSKEKRIYDLYLPFVEKNENHYEINIPENYEVYYIPENFSIDKPLIKYQKLFSIDKKNGKIKFTTSQAIGGGTVKRKDYTNFRNNINELSSFSREWIVLKKK